MDTSSGSGSEAIRTAVADLNETVVRMAVVNASIANVLKIKDCPEVTNEQYEFSSSFSLATEGKLSHTPAERKQFFGGPSSVALTPMRTLFRPRRFRKMYLENILPRGSQDRDPRYPKGVSWDQFFFFKFFLMQTYLGIYS